MPQGIIHKRRYVKSGKNAALRRTRGFCARLRIEIRTREMAPAGPTATRQKTYK